MNETSMAARAVANGGRNISRSLNCFASSETSKIYRQSRRKAAISLGNARFVDKPEVICPGPGLVTGSRLVGSDRDCSQLKRTNGSNADLTRSATIF